MSNHTPGPWQVEYDELTEEWLVFWKRGYASVGGFNNTYNAHLIAAAPEMLERLEYLKIRLQVVCDDFEDIETDIDLLGRLIAKAKGETE